MKKHLLPLVILTLLIVPASAEKPSFSLRDSLIFPVSPAVMAQGGSFTAVAHGWDALFTNPAGFARKDGSFTLLSPSVWVYGRPDWLLQDIPRVIGAIGSSDFQNILINAVKKQFDGTTESGVKQPGGGFGVGTSAGLGFVGGGIGLGIVLTTDSFLSGDRFPLGVTGNIRANLGLIGGLAVPFDLFGMHFSLGGDIRYFIQALSPVNAKQFTELLSGAGDMNNLLKSIPAWDGYGLGFDLGLIAEAGPFSIGVSARDVASTRIDYMKNNLDDLISAIASSGSLPIGETSPSYIPTELNFGLGFHPDFGKAKWLIDPMIHAEMKDVLRTFDPEASLMKSLHVGASVKVLSFISLRAGLNQGYFTFGAGLKLLFLDINAAVFTRELGNKAGDSPSSGAVIEAALRF